MNLLVVIKLNFCVKEVEAMRRKTLILFLLTMLFNSCSLNNSNLINNSSFSEYQSYYKYPEFAEYYETHFWYYAIFCWKIDDTTWKSGLINYKQGTNPHYLELLHIQNCIPCDLPILGEIIKSVDGYSERMFELYEIDYPYINVHYEKRLSENITFLCAQMDIPLSKIYDSCKKDGN